MGPLVTVLCLAYLLAYPILWKSERQRLDSPFRKLLKSK